MVKRLLSLFTAVFLFSTGVVSFARSDVNFTVVFDPDTKLVSVSGEGNGIVTIKLVPEGTDLSELSAANPPIDFYQLKAGGSYTYSFYMPDSAPAGKYDVYVTGHDTPVTIMYFDLEDADYVVSELKSKTELSEFTSFFLSKLPELGIDSDNADIKGIEAELASELYKEKAKFTTGADFNKHAMKHAAILNFARADAEYILNQYALFLGIDYANDWEKDSKLTQQIKAKVLDNLKSIDYTDDCNSAKAVLNSGINDIDFPEIFMAYKVLSTLQLCSDWMSVKKVYEDSYKDILSDITENNISYSSLSSASVYGILINKSFDSISDIRDNFDMAVKEAKEASNSTGSSSSSRPSGGKNNISVGGVGAGVITPVYDETSTYDEQSKITTFVGLPKLTVADAAFWDISSKHWANKAVGTLAAVGIVSGYSDGSFKPDIQITRAEFSKLIVSAFSVKSMSQSFNDVLETDWFYPYVGAAAGAGIVKGYEGNFSPNAIITREDAAVMLYRVSSLFGIDYSGIKKFKDFDQVSLYAWTAVGALANNNVISGVNGDYFEPKASLTRAQAAQLIYKLSISLGEKGAS